LFLHKKVHFETLIVTCNNNNNNNTVFNFLGLTVVDTTNNDTFEYHNILEVNILKDTELNVTNEEQLLDLEVKQKSQQTQQAQQVQQFIQNSKELMAQERDVQLTTENKVIVDIDNNEKEYIELTDSYSDQKIEREQQFGLGNNENFDNVDNSIPLSITEILNDNNDILRKKQNEILTGESNGEDIEGDESNNLNLNSSQSIVDIDLHSSQSINSSNQSLNSSQSIVDSIADIDLNASRGEEDK
jgi:hypothetical protein